MESHSLLNAHFGIHVVGKPRQAAVEGQCLDPVSRVDPDSYRGCCQRLPEFKEDGQQAFLLREQSLIY